jgi:4-oxalocrotonate tautomerase
VGSQRDDKTKTVVSTLKGGTNHAFDSSEVDRGSFTPAQKKEIISKLTDAMVSIEGENMRPATWVVIEKARSGEWGIGGQAMTTDAVRALAAGKK